MEQNFEKLALLDQVSVGKISEEHAGKKVSVKGFVSALRETKTYSFITLRDGMDTIQMIIANNSKLDVALECFVSCKGIVNKASKPITSCTVQNFEIELVSIEVLGPVVSPLPFSFKDAAATEEEKAKNPSIANVAYNLRLDNRSLDFRLPQTQAIVRVIDGTMAFFREFLRKQGFIEIKTTKIIKSGSEGGSNLFTMNYFDKVAYLAQSPQLYKQMAIIGGLKKVYEIGHVYRAEVSNINRYLSEFTGMDIEMEMDGTYIDIIHFIYSVFVHIFDGLSTEYSREIELIRKFKNFKNIRYGKTPFIISHHDAVDLLKEKGINIAYEDDFSRENEKILGEIIAEKHSLDLFVIKDYPASARAFYTYVDSEGKTRSYDFVLRGEEILSGAQRINDYDALVKAIERKGIDPKSLDNYLEPFKYGAPPHGGCGIGLERLLKAYFGFDDIRYFALFPRDPNRLYP